MTQKNDSPIDPRVYSMASAGSLSAKLAFRIRKRIYAKLAECFPPEKMCSVLDVGVTADRECSYSNYFEILYPFPERVTALSDQDASWIEKDYPGMKFVRGDGRDLPFADNSFDLVFSSAVLEHVGSRSMQKQMISECYRVAAKSVFLTTPNRWHPMELHTALPFLHWLPPECYRRILRWIGYERLASENMLNLISRQELAELCEELGLMDRMRILYEYFCGIPSNLLLVIEKKS